jgi:transglutaminase-like putative cysteine protease
MLRWRSIGPGMRLSLVSAAILLCAIAPIAPARSGDRAKFASLEPLLAEQMPPEFLKYPAVVLLEDERMEISGSSAIQEQRLVKKILKPGHAEDGAFLFRTSDASRILEIKARAVYPDGRERILSSDDFGIVPDFEDFVLYSDQKSYSFRIPGLVAETVIEVYLKRRIDNLVYWEPALFQGDAPILTRRYTLRYPDDLAVTVRATCMPETPDSRTAPARGMQELVWERRNIEPLRRESMMPSVTEYLPALWFSLRGPATLGAALEADSWSGVADWYRRISEKSLEPGEELRAMLEPLRAPGASERARAAGIYRWVQANLRYVAIILGDGGFRPHKTEDILANRYGDCKDMSVVLAAALEEAGIEAHLVLVRTADLGRVPGAAPSPFRFNHAIVAAAVDGDTMYLDPTCDTCGFGILPEGDQGAEALMVRKGEERLTTLPFGTPRPNRRDVSIEAAVAGDGDAGVTITMQFDGCFSAEVRRRLDYRKGKSTPEAVAAMLKEDMPAFRLESVRIDGADPASDILTITAKGTIPEMLDAGKPYSFVRCVFNPLAVELPDCGDRFYPIEIGTPSSRKYDISIVLPDLWRAVDAPPSGEVRNGYFDYRYSGGVDGQEVRFSRSWSNTARIVPAAECGELRDGLKTIGDIEARQISFERKQ